MQILIVVVLYKCSARQSRTITTLADVFAQNPALLQSFRVFVWDNSPGSLEDQTIPFPSEYRHADYNSGTSGAYNHAMRFAESIGSPWLLLFDQDTTVAHDFLPRMLAYGTSLEPDPSVGAVAGFIYSHGSLVSPRRLLSFNRVQQIAPPFHGICRDRAYAVNSATLMRVAALNSIGGYSEEFWLDLSDVYVFQKMFYQGKYLYVAGDITVEHSIASMDFDKEMSLQRYQNFIAAESAFVDLYLPPFERMAQLLRLFVRTVRQYRRYQNKNFARISWRYFCRRLFQSRAARLRDWRRQLAQREIPLVEHGKVIG